MSRFRLVKKQRVPLTAEEETVRDAEEAQAVIDKQARDDAIAQEATDKANANQKLLDLGLTQAEVDAFKK